MIEVKEPDEIMIELTQKMLRQPGRDRETIGFTIMRVIRTIMMMVILVIVVIIIMIITAPRRMMKG
jgi:hypothetical protein